MLSNPRLEVAIIAPPTRPVPPVRGGGAQLVIHQTVQHIQDYQVVVYSVADPQLPPTHWDHGVEYVHLPISGRYLLHNFWIDRLQKPYRFYAAQIAVCLNERQPQIVHVHSNPWVLLAIRRKLTYKPVLILHHHTMPINRSFSPWEANRLLGCIHAFVGVSDYVIRTEVSDKYSRFAFKSHVIYNAVDHHFFVPPRNVLARSTEMILLFVGQIRHDKGVDSLLESFELLLPRYPQLRLVMVGSASGGTDQPTKDQQHYFDRFQRKVSHFSGKVELIDFLDRGALREQFQRADIFCAPSLTNETFGLVIAEAMACGLPVVTSTRGGIPEVVGAAGILVDRPEAPEELAHALDRLISNANLRQSLGRQARERIETCFTWEQTARTTEALYSQLLG